MRKVRVWKPSRLSAGWSTALSPQISDSNAEPSAVKCPTTVKSRCPKRIFSPMPQPAKRGAMRLPTIASSVPGVNMRPSTILTAERTARPSGLIARTVTLEEPGCPSRGLLVTTTISGLASGRPSGPVATSGWERTMLAASREM